jgi:hypothetical protein
MDSNPVPKAYWHECIFMFFNLFFFLIRGAGLWILRSLTGLLYQPRMIGDGDCGEISPRKTQPVLMTKTVYRAVD